MGSHIYNILIEVNFVALQEPNFDNSPPNSPDGQNGNEDDG